MSKTVDARRPLRSFSSENMPENNFAIQIEHESEREARLEEQHEDGKLRRWKEKTLLKAFLAFAACISGMWVYVVLSGRFSPAVAQQVTEVVKAVLLLMAGFIAGKGADKWLGS